MTDYSLTPSQAAAELGVNVRTVQRWVSEGRLPAQRIGGRLRLSRSSLASVVAVDSPARPVVALRRVLVANRGEIAARVFRAARALGMEVVAVHAPDERAAPGADREVAVPHYLDGQAIVRAALESRADAVHPGYGFLSENADFARSVQAAGLAWVGPPPGAIAAMGDKAAARRTAAEQGVPILPGYEGDAPDEATLVREADRIGLPLLVKAAAGGGGKGMRVVRERGELPEALAAARREAARAFGSEQLILERLLVGARHVEIQVLFDAHGNAVHLGERDCSAQRRNQKVLEEAPGPSVDAELRERMGDAALTVARAVGYVNAGTVEFLVDDARRFYFLEMNTRLQVEHPVTEEVTGRDLVADQLRIAAGEPLGFGQEDVRMHGHAMEVRLYAEDPEHGFLPATGTVLRLRWPNGIRLETGLREGDAVTDRYDPMLAKLVAHGSTRRLALERLRTALDATQVLGVRTNLRFLRWLLDQPVMRDGEVRTDTIGEMRVPGPPHPRDEAWRAAAAAAGAAGLLPAGEWGGGWRLNAPPSVRLRLGEEERRVALTDAAADDAADDVAVAADPAAGAVHVEVEGQSLEFRVAAPPTVEEAVRHAAAHGEEHAVLTAPMPGQVIAVRAAEGASVQAHQAVVVLEAMKMEHAVVTPLAGTLTRVAVAEGQQVQRGDVLAEVSA